ncbi:TKT, partial [Cordylochernes scorpioides]
MRYKVSDPKDPSSDRFVLSKKTTQVCCPPRSSTCCLQGHAAPILYAAWAEAGLFPVADLMNLRKLDSDLEGHPTPRLRFVDVATGSLGQGLSCAAGMAYTGKYLDKASYRVYCIIGDGESAEGSVWEAMAFASHYKLDNLVAIFDINRLGQSDPTPLQHNIEVYAQRAASFGFHPIMVDGHDVSALLKAFQEAQQVKDKPTAILAKTYKGNAFPAKLRQLCAEIHDKENWHGKPLGDKADAVIAALNAKIEHPGLTSIVAPAPQDDASPVSTTTPIQLPSPPQYNLGDKMATRQAYGTAIAKLGSSSPRVIALDGDTKNSTFSQTFLKAHPGRFIECFIAEQNMVGVAIGCSTRGRTVPFVSTFAAFFTRAFDQLRMGAISFANIKCAGSHAGISIGEDGPSQMALEDLSMFRSLPNSTVFYPSDAVSTERACELAANQPGICYIRTSRPATPVIYAPDTVFSIGKAMVTMLCRCQFHMNSVPEGLLLQVVRQSPEDKVLVIGAAVTLVEAQIAADKLQEEGLHIRVMDPFTIKPLDKTAVLEHAKVCGGRVLVVEDHYTEGGLSSVLVGHT